MPTREEVRRNAILGLVAGAQGSTRYQSKTFATQQVLDSHRSEIMALPEYVMPTIQILDTASANFGAGLWTLDLDPLG